MDRRPIAAGRFYEEDAGRLRRQLAVFFDNVPEAECKTEEKVHAIVSPHAGYVFSGQTAAYSFSAIRPESLHNPLFVILGPDHTGACPGVSVSACDNWITPFGKCRVNDDIRDWMGGNKLINIENRAHSSEHSIEVQLPFLQYIMQNRPFTILPIALSIHDTGSIEKTGELLVQMPERHNGTVVFVISSDFSHYVSPQKASEDDRKTIDILLNGSMKERYIRASDPDLTVCGIIPALTYLSGFSQCVAGRLLHYSTSGDIMPMDEVVGYAAIVFTKREG
ncbi:MAG: AmmeMemoRadiSam system protein B [Candidatus Muiribacteriaceae bacterium]